MPAPQPRAGRIRRASARRARCRASPRLAHGRRRQSLAVTPLVARKRAKPATSASAAAVGSELSPIICSRSSNTSSAVDRGRRAAQHGADEEAPAVGRPHRMADFLHLAEQWQTLIAGLLGLAGGVIAYLGARHAASRQVAAVESQTVASRDALAEAEERSRNAVIWAIRSEARRLESEAHARRRALPSAPQPADLDKGAIIIASSPLLRGERERISRSSTQKYNSS